MERLIFTAASASAFFALPAEALDGRTHSLDVVVSEGGGVTLQEAASFAVGSGAGRAVVEILALHPKFLAHLHEKAGQAARLSIYLDGELREDNTFGVLLQKSRELEGQALVPVKLERRADADEGHHGLKPLAAALTGIGCVNQCDTYAQSCYAVCDRYGRPNCETDCETRFMNCLHGCGCPVVVSSSTTTTFLGYTLVTPISQCLADTPGNPPPAHFYLQYNANYKNEHYNQVVQCDGASGSVLASVDYTTKTCWHYDMNSHGLPCYNPIGGTFGACTF